jgi:hypothetical protein
VDRFLDRLMGVPVVRAPSTGRAGALMVTVVLTALGAVAATWPLAREMGRATLRSGEVLLTAWQINWFQQALLTDPLGWADATIFFPYDRTAAYNDLLISHALVALPAYWADSPVLALNLAFLGGIVLCGVFAHLMIDELVDHPWAAVVGGTLFALAPFRFLHVGHISIAAAWAIPLFFWLLLRHLRTPSMRGATLVAVSGLLVALSSLYHAAYVAPLTPLVLLAGARRGPNSRRVWLPLAAIAAPALALLAWFLAPFVWAMDVHGIASAPDDLLTYGADLTSLAQRPAFLDESALESGINPEAHLYPGTALAGLAIAGVLAAIASVPRAEGWRRGLLAGLAGVMIFIGLGFVVPFRAGLDEVWTAGVLALLWAGPVGLLACAVAVSRRTDPCSPAAAMIFGIAAASAAFVLGLGPQVRYLTRPIGVAPYWLLTQVSSSFAGTRVPARFGGLVMLFLAIVAAAVLVAMWRANRASVRRAGAAAAVSALAVCAVELPVPALPRGYDLVELPSLQDPAYRWLAAQPGSFGVLELPDWPHDADVHYRHREWRALRHMLAAKQHGKHLVNGTGRIEPFLWVRFRWLEPWSREFFTYIASYLPVDFVLVHERGVPEAQRAAVWDSVTGATAGWQPMMRSPAIRVFRVDRSFGHGVVVDRLLLRRDYEGRARVEFAARRAPAAAGENGPASPVTLELLRDGEAVSSFEIDADWRSFAADVPILPVPSDWTSEWPRTGSLLRWRVRGDGKELIELRAISIQRADESTD